ncbi:MAG: hypothetical protein NWE93_11695 [Candidatus Bathyarchaeota archaeon]|nr:hypothetical protein [Candidatus Bathyarchaeota archaeon]
MSKMRRHTFAVTATLALLAFSIASISFVSGEQPPFNFVTPWVWENPPKLIVESPINETYTEKVLLNFTVEAPNNWFNNQSEKWKIFNLYNTAIEQKLISVTYILDGCSTTIPLDNNLGSPFKGSIELVNLTEGTHQLIISSNATGVYRSFRGFFAQTQINDPSRTIVDFGFIPTPTPSLTISSDSQLPQVFNIGIALVIVSMVIGSLLIIRRHRKIC